MSKPKNSTSESVPQDVLFELLTPSEVRMIKNRWRIIQLVEEGLSIRKIAQMAKVGTDTVVRMSKKIEQNSKIRNFLGLNISQNRKNSILSSKWVFGQVGKEKQL